MAKKQFKSESKRLLDLMINSIYTHKEIFLRELISNSSDAIDKLYYKSLTDQNIKLIREDFKIELAADKKDRVLTIKDNGIGMTEEELESNLGTIARSGSMLFKKENEQKEDIDIIGQFGVGFYSAFMVSDEVTVISKAYGSDKAYKWFSTGADGYTITECEKDSVGTEITLKIKANTDDENYDDYLDQYHLTSLVKKYSDYIRYPIVMEVEKSRLKEGSDKDYETYTEKETLNSMIPIWKRNKSELKDEDYNQFYKDKFYDFEDPVKVIHVNTEGALTFNAILFIPSKTPYDFYSPGYERGLQLYSRGVFIMEKCADLLPEHFRFIKGLVDSQDLSLNISREMLQHDRQLKAIASTLEKKIKSELLGMLKNDREKYEKFYKNFGLQLKYGVYNGFGVNKDTLKDLLLFYSSTEKKLVTIEEYITRMKEDQKYIYYVPGESVEKLDKLPLTERIRDKGYEILYLTEDVDEFAIRMLDEYDGKHFKSISSGDAELESDKEKKQLEEKAGENKDLLEAIKSALGDKVKDVRISARLKSNPVCLVSDAELSLEMEKVLSSMPGGEKVKAQKILEINPDHAVFTALQKVYTNDKDSVKDYAQLLYDQAMLIEGFPIEDPVDFSNKVCDLMIKANA